MIPIRIERTASQHGNPLAQALEAGDGDALAAGERAARQRELELLVVRVA